MLTTIKNLLSSLFDSFQTVFDFVQNLIDKLFQFFHLVGTAVTYAVEVVGTLPAWLVVFAVAGITVSVIYLIVGRNTN